MNSGRPVISTLRVLASFLLISFLSSPFLLGADHSASKSSIPRPHGDKLALRDHWALQSSAKVEAKGEVISSARYIPRGWHQVTVPTTVVAALVKDKTLPDPFFATNLRQFPGVTYPIAGNFST